MGSPFVAISSEWNCSLKRSFVWGVKWPVVQRRHTVAAPHHVKKDIVAEKLLLNRKIEIFLYIVNHFFTQNSESPCAPIANWQSERKRFIQKTTKEEARHPLKIDEEVSKAGSSRGLKESKTFLIKAIPPTLVPVSDFFAHWGRLSPRTGR